MPADQEVEWCPAPGPHSAGRGRSCAITALRRSANLERSPVSPQPVQVPQADVKRPSVRTRESDSLQNGLIDHESRYSEEHVDQQTADLQARPGLADAADLLRADGDSEREANRQRKSTLPTSIQYKIQGRKLRTRPIAYLCC